MSRLTKTALDLFTSAQSILSLASEISTQTKMCASNLVVSYGIFRLSYVFGEAQNPLPHFTRAPMEYRAHATQKHLLDFTAMRAVANQISQHLGWTTQRRKLSSA